MNTQLSTLVAALENPLYGVAIMILAIWALIWKGIALWKAARHGQNRWFIALLVLNTAGILEIAYIFWFQKKSSANDKV